MDPMTEQETFVPVDESIVHTSKELEKLKELEETAKKLSEHVDELEKKVKNLASFTRIQCDINNVLRFLVRKKYSENELNEALKEYEEYEKHLKNDENEEKK